MKQQIESQRRALRGLVKTHRKEFSLIAGLCGLCFVLGWLWNGMWLIAALCLLHLIGQWGRYTEERLASGPENTRVGLYQRIWGEDWQRALSRDHPQLLGKSQQRGGG